METENPQPDKKKPRKSFKKVSDWTGLLRNFATIVASFISLITLFILIRQNERTYQPEVVFKPDQSVFRIFYRENPTSCSDIQIAGVADSSPVAIHLNASNIGLGAAKNLEAQWQFDPEQMDDTLSIGPLSIATQAEYNDQMKLLLFYNCYREERFEQYAEFCLPVNMEKEPVRFTLPETYLHAWSNILIRTVHHPSELRISALKDAVRKFQQLQFSVRYQDINNRSYSKTYRVRMIPALIDLRKKEMLVAWRISGETGRRNLTEKYKITITREDGSNMIAQVDLY